MSGLVNVAGWEQARADEQLERELLRARALVVRLDAPQPHSEVKTVVQGTCGPLRLVRAWRYWVAKGPVPLRLARMLYADPVGREDVRVAGHCGCPPPEEWAKYELDASTGKRTLGYVDSYHVDSEVGLRLLCDHASILP